MKKTVGDNLRALRLRNNLSMQDVGNKLNVTSTAILKYEHNKTLPGLKRLEELALIYNTTIDEILDVDNYNEITFINLKCNGSVSAVREEKIKNILRKKIDDYFTLLKLSNIKLQNRFGVHIIKDLEEAEMLASKLRIFFTISLDAPISDLAYLLETNGIILITIPKDEIKNDFLGFYENINGIPIIAVPKADNGYEQRYNIAKYLGELLIVADKNKDEITSRFALSLLMPKQSLINEFGVTRVKIDINELKAYSLRYKVSYKSILRRLEMCQIITPSNAKYFNIFINKNKIKESYFIEEAHNFNKMLYKLVALGSIKDPKQFL